MRAFAEINNVNVGDTLVADGCFDCLSEGEEVVVFADEHGELCIHCSHGDHNLNGQIGFFPEDEHLYIGLYKKEI